VFILRESSIENVDIENIVALADHSAAQHSVLTLACTDLCKDHQLIARALAAVRLAAIPMTQEGVTLEQLVEFASHMEATHSG